MKRRSRLFLIISFLCVLLLGGSPISARSPSHGRFAGLSSVGGTWDSGIKIQNLSSTDTASVVPYFYNETYPSGFSVTGSSIPPGGSVEYWLPAVSEVPAGKYSAVISSDEPIAAVSTHTNYSVGIADSYNGVSAGASTLYVPYVYRGLNDWFTEITVQNCDDATTANVSLTVRGEGLGSPITYGPVAVQPNGAYTFDTSTSEFSALGSAFKGSATVTSTEGVDLAGAVNEIRVGGSTHVMTSFRALTSADAGSLILLPSLYKHFGNLWRSGIQIQNTSDSATATVNITFRLDPGVLSGGPWTKSGVTIDPQEAYQFYLPVDTVDGGGTLPDGFKGSATIEASGADVSAMVIHTNYAADLAEGFIGLPPSAGTSHLSTPSLYKNFGSGSYIWRSGIKVQNVSTTDPVRVDFTFTADPGCPGGGTLSDVDIDPGEAFEFYLPSANLDTAVPLPDMFKGSAVVAVDGAGTIVGTVIHTNYGRGVANMYGAINYTPSP